MIDGQLQIDSALFGLGLEPAGEFGLVRLDQRLPCFQPAGFEEGVGHRAADQYSVGRFQQVFDHLNLVRNFRAAENHHKGPSRIAQGFHQIA